MSLGVIVDELYYKYHIRHAWLNIDSFCKILRGDLAGIGALFGECADYGCVWRLGGWDATGV